MRPTARPVLTLLASLAGLALLAGPALAQYPPQAGDVTDADLVVENPAATIEVEGRDWSGGTLVEISYQGDGQPQQVIGRVRTAQDGSFRTQVTLPQGVNAEDVTFTVAESPGADGETASQTFTVAATGDGSGGTTDDVSDEALASTGAPTGAMGLAVGLLAAGGLALGGARWWGRHVSTGR